MEATRAPANHGHVKIKGCLGHELRKPEAPEECAVGARNVDALRRLARLMRGLPVMLILALIVAPSGLSHTDHPSDCDVSVDSWNHIQTWTVTLEANETIERTLGFNRCPLEAEWIVLLRGDTDGILNLALGQNGTAIGRTVWDGALNFDTWTLPHTDFATLHLHNPGAQNVTATLYFDQTCLCPAKATDLVPGPLWMNALANPGDAVDFEVVLIPVLFPAETRLPDTITVHATVLGDAASKATWTFKPHEEEPCNASTRWMACFNYGFEATLEGRQDVLLWLDHDSSDAWSLQVRPVIEVTPPVQDAPGLGFLMSTLALVAGAFVIRRRLGA